MATWKPENVLLTLKGNEALSKVLAGQGKLTVTRIVAGAGYVSPSTLYNQKNVSNIKQTLEVNRVVTDANGSEISTTLSNINLDTAYSLYQIGVYCKHTDSDEEFLYLIAQCETDKPDNIPAKTDTVANFSYNLYIQHEGTTQFEVTVNQPGAISVSMLGKPNGVATLDSSGKVPSEQIPSLECAFYAIYGTTTLAEIKAAHETGKVVYMKKGTSRFVYPLITLADSFAQFAFVSYSGDLRRCTCQFVDRDIWREDEPAPLAKMPVSTAVTLSASGWNSSSKTQTVTVSGVLADETKQLITPAPALASQTAYYEAVVLCTGQAANQLTFTAKKIPTADLTVYVTIQGVSA